MKISYEKNITILSELNDEELFIKDVNFPGENKLILVSELQIKRPII